MRDQESPLTGKGYPTSLVLKVAGVSSACWYGKRTKGANPSKRGPKTSISDEDLLVHVRREIVVSKFHSEGYKKIRARLKRRDIRVGKNRVYRLMEVNSLLAPVRAGTGTSRTHDGTIKTEIPNQMWATDGKKFYTEEDGRCWFFGVIDHCNDEILAWHAVKKGDRFAAMEPVREATRREYGCVAKGIVKDIGLTLRADHGTQYDSNDFQKEIKFLGFEYSPAFVRSPECNGIIERFHRILNEQVLSTHQFKNLDEARKIIGKFIDDYNNDWILERLGYRTPLEYKEYLKTKAELAA
ncbi:DDE-type integrase/transposase/recombinase [bacterium]|nr:DDE-type integrase/transposase/recombinase [bacterium]